MEKAEIDCDSAGNIVYPDLGAEKVGICSLVAIHQAVQAKIVHLSYMHVRLLIFLMLMKEEYVSCPHWGLANAWINLVLYYSVLVHCYSVLIALNLQPNWTVPFPTASLVCVIKFLFSIYSVGKNDAKI